MLTPLSTAAPYPMPVNQAVMNQVPIRELTQELETLCQRRTTGTLVLNTASQEGKLHLVEGQLLYVTSDFHRVRRWYRATKKSCPNWRPQSGLLSLDSETPWEYQLLDLGITDEQLTIAQAKAVMGQVALEVLFSIAEQTTTTYRFESYTEPALDVYPGLTLSQDDWQPLLTKVAHLQSQWQTAGLGGVNPILAPILRKQVEAKSLSTWDKYLNGKFTLWDIAARLGKSVTSVARALLPLVNKGLVQLRTVPDLPDPGFQLAPTGPDGNSGGAVTFASSTPEEGLEGLELEFASPSGPANQPLIACIDDSPVVAQTLKNILEPAGYRVLGIQDPVQALAQIAKHKPDLIFLDLVMPHANGYTVCQFLRNAPLFRNTPVIILTSRDNVVDRSRTMLAGASGFLGKPPKPKETLRMVSKYLSASASSKNSSY
ncbi:MAG: response regulator [Microcoleaceae cyanobacterium]